MNEDSAVREPLFNASSGAALDRFAVALLELAANGQITGFNQAWTELMGTSARPRNAVEYVHQEDRSLWLQALAQLSANPGSSFRQRLRFVHPDGDLRWCEVGLKSVVSGFCLVISDITAHKRRETALQASHRSAMSLLESMPGLIYRGRNNRDWTMEFVSAGCLQLTGYPAERLVDNHDFTYSSLILPDDADYVWREVQYALARQVPFELSYRIRCADGSIKNVWEKGVGIFAGNQEVLGIEGAIFERMLCASECR